MQRALSFAGLIVLLLMAVAGPAAAAQAERVSARFDWPQFDFDSSHSGNNTRESTITPANVNQLARFYQVALPSPADGAPVYLAGVQTPLGIRNLLFVTTRDGRIIALDAASGSTVWAKRYGPGACRINNGATPCYTTSSPALDPNRLYVYSYGLDGRVHKYRVGSGLEVSGSGFPALATRKRWDEKGSSALTVATSASGRAFLYVTNGGYSGDQGDYQGHVTAINLATGAAHVFNTVCSNRTIHFVSKPKTPDCPEVQSAVWARAGVVYDPTTDRIYLATGNGTYAPDQYDWGDTVFSLRPNAVGANGKPLDSYTPTNYQQLQDSDTDLGSTAPALLPVPAGSRVQHLALMGGKDAKLRLLDLADLSGQGSPGHTGGEIGPIINVPQGGEVLTQPAVWVNPADNSAWVFVANGRGISGLGLTLDANGTPGLQLRWQSSNEGTSPILANNVLYYVSTGNLWALDPKNGTVLWHNSQVGNIHWSSPIVAAGVLYVTDLNGNLSAYSLNGVLP